MIHFLLPAKAALDLVNNDNSTEAPDVGDQLLHVLWLREGHPVEGEDGLHEQGGDLGSVNDTSLDQRSGFLEILAARVRVFLAVGTAVEVGDRERVNL